MGGYFGGRQTILSVTAGSVLYNFSSTNYYADTTFAALVGVAPVAAEQQADFDDADLTPAAKLMGTGKMLKIFLNCHKQGATQTNGKYAKADLKRFRVFVARDKLKDILAIVGTGANAKEAIVEKILKDVKTTKADGTESTASWVVDDLDFKRDASFTM